MKLEWHELNYYHEGDGFPLGRIGRVADRFYIKDNTYSIPLHYDTAYDLESVMRTIEEFYESI